MRVYFGERIKQSHQTLFIPFVRHQQSFSVSLTQHPPLYCGVVIDRQARALDHRGELIPGLYAVGELNGSVGINGKYGLDGMFLGPAIITGRLAGQSIAAAHAVAPIKPAVEPISPSPDAGSWQAALDAEDLESILAEPRDGYWHFQVSHKLVLERGYQCTRCHSAQLPFSPVNDRQSLLAQTQVCTHCH